MKTYTDKCRERDPLLPEDWEVYEAECLPQPKDGEKDWKATHIRVVGSVARLLKSGKNKGKKTWRDRIHEKEFIFSCEELAKDPARMSFL